MRTYTSIFFELIKKIKELDYVSDEVKEEDYFLTYICFDYCVDDDGNYGDLILIGYKLIEDDLAENSKLDLIFKKDFGKIGSENVRLILDSNIDNFNNTGLNLVSFDYFCNVFLKNKIHVLIEKNRKEILK